MADPHMFSPSMPPLPSCSSSSHAASSTVKLASSMVCAWHGVEMREGAFETRVRHTQCGRSVHGS
jgi:hypothetical protein